MNLFYAPPTAINDGWVNFDEDESRHASQVLRAKIGDEIWVTDGQGHRHYCEIESIGKKTMRLRILKTQFTPKPNLPILAVGLLKNRERLEWIVEKSVELGVDTLVLMHTNRSERAHVREDRLRGIQISAMKQCLTDWLPSLEVSAFENVLRRYELHPKYIAHEKADLKETLTLSEENESPLLLVGPEGGFTENEMDQAMASGAKKVSLGPRRLRTETAALAMQCAVVLGDGFKFKV